MTHAQEHSPHEGQRLTAEEVGARVGAILGAAEREAREIIAAARREPVAEAPSPPAGATIDDLARAIERLSARIDAFELSTAARIEELAAELRSALPSAEATPELPAAPGPEDSSAGSAARVRAIDLALAGYSREAIATELAVSMPRGEVEALLDQVLVS